MPEPIRLGAAWVARVMGGRFAGGSAAAEFAAVSIDTRTIGRGELYIGIRGERFDGADFAAAAIEAGAAGVVVPAGRGAALKALGAVVIEVADTTAALQALGHAVRVESGTQVVAITGSAGKTTTKEVAAEFLAARYRVIRNRGNLNNHIGLPLSLVELRERPQIAVVELGMNHAGEISTLVGIAEPDVRVWTNVGEAHLGFFGSVDAIADAKAEILERATSRTVLVSNADDDRIVQRTARFPGRVTTFGIDRDATVRAHGVIDRGIGGTSARVETPRGNFDLVTPLVGRGNLANVLAAIGVAIYFEVPLDELAGRARYLTPASHRGEVQRLGRGVVVIDDSYNANPTATRRALEVLATDASGASRVAFLGEMLELGDRALELHQEVGRAAAAARLAALVTIGGAPAQALATSAVAAGMDRARVRWFATSDEAAAAAPAIAGTNALVLVKGSRGIRTDRVVERLIQELA